MEEPSTMFRPPINRAMYQLDRAFFKKDIALAAARIYNPREISKIRQELNASKAILTQRSIPSVQIDPSDSTKTQKCILLHENIRPDDESTWPATASKLVDNKSISIFQFPLTLDYLFWSAHDILSAVLPETLHDDIPTGFNGVGHIAHLNLRDALLPWKTLIGQVTLDKNPSIRTAVNKTETLGSTNEFRVLDLELLAGEPDYNVDVREGGCTFRFDFSKVFWNSRLGTEHGRLVDKFKAGEVVCDVMAGVGPFAIPAGKKGIFVWGNDLNPDCYEGLVTAIGLNKVAEFVQGFCEDGHTFIQDAAKRLLSEDHKAKIPIKMSRTEAERQGIKPEDRFTYVERPKIFSHFVMNLPATAIDFLPDYIGLYAGHEELFEPHTQTKLPMVHCYCFAPKSMDDSDPDAVDPRDVVVGYLRDKLQHDFTVDTPELEIFDVRNVAPKKSQYCATFRLPYEVAFRNA